MESVFDEDFDKSPELTIGRVPWFGYWPLLIHSNVSCRVETVPDAIMKVILVDNERYEKSLHQKAKGQLPTSLGLSLFLAMTLQLTIDAIR